MPRRVPIDTAFAALAQAQDAVITRAQALGTGHTVKAVTCRLADRWQELLPSVYLTVTGQPTRRQMFIAALLYAGPSAAIDAVDACHFHGVRAVTPDPAHVHVVVPWGEPARSRRFVRVRRTTREFETQVTGAIRYVDAPTAVIAAGRPMRSERMLLALFSDAVQRRIVTPSALLKAHVRGPRRGSKLADLALSHVLGGAASVPEARFRELAEASAVLPPLLYNCVLRLPTGQLISPDALDVSAGLVHEVNGRLAHARTDLFEDMQRRHDAMTVAGLTVLHNAPRRIETQGYAVIAEVEACHLRLAGRGLPSGVEIVNLAAT